MKRLSTASPFLRAAHSSGSAAVSSAGKMDAACSSGRLATLRSLRWIWRVRTPTSLSSSLLANRRLLILDEATSNVDTRTEILIQKAMDKLMRGRTCFVIAHRLSTIVDADRILVINDGQIVETGTHRSLLKQKGFYYRLYTSQYAV